MNAVIMATNIIINEIKHVRFNPRSVVTGRSPMSASLHLRIILLTHTLE